MQLPTSLDSVRLVSWAAEHRDGLVAQANDKAVWRNLFAGFPHPYTPQDADFWIAHACAAEPSCHLCILAGGAVAGGVGVAVGTGTDEKTGEFGYWLGREFWGRGIATAAAAAMLKHALERLPVIRLQAPVFEWNPRSMRVLEKIGFQKEAVLRKSVFKDGELIDAVLYALIVGDS